MKSRRIRVIVSFAILAVLAIGAAFLYLRKPAIRKLAEPPNVLLITIDTIRPDRVSCYGGNNPTPALDRIASEGILFENTFSQVPLTFPSHTSILTAMYPIHHGVHQNGLEVLGHQDWVISRIFRENGYKTGAVVSSFVLDRKFGLAGSFDVYDDHMERKPGIVSNFDVERPANEVTDAARRILSGFSGNRWFLWLHFYDPHTPYAPPPPLEGYEGEIRFVDQQIGELRAWLAEQKLDQNLVIAITGDHGESLGEHGEATHGFFVYNSTVRVPMMLSYPGAPRRKVTTPVATVDLLPTVLEIAGLHDPMKRDGQSLATVLQDAPRTAPILTESRYPELLGWNRLEALVQDRWKLISTTRSELYDWQKDSLEATNLYSREEQTSSAMKRQLASFQESEPAASSQPDAETLEKLKSLGYISTTSVAKRGTADPKDKIAVWAEYEQSLKLKSAGKKEEATRVLAGIASRESDNPFFLTTLASDYRAAGKPQEAIPHLEAAIRLDPQHGNAYQELALDYRDLRNFPEALRAARAAVTLEPTRSDFHGVLGLLYVDTGDYAAAEQEFTRLLSIDPNNAVALNNLGNALRAEGRMDEAASAYRKSIDLSPHYGYPLNGLATILISQKKPEEAVPLLEKAIDLDPQFVEVYLNLGIAFHTMGQLEKARTCYLTFLKLSPDWMQQERANAQALLQRLR